MSDENAFSKLGLSDPSEELVIEDDPKDTQSVSADDATDEDTVEEDTVEDQEDDQGEQEAADDADDDGDSVDINNMSNEELKALAKKQVHAIGSQEKLNQKQQSQMDRQRNEATVLFGNIQTELTNLRAEINENNKAVANKSFFDGKNDDDIFTVGDLRKASETFGQQPDATPTANSAPDLRAVVNLPAVQAASDYANKHLGNDPAFNSIPATNPVARILYAMNANADAEMTQAVTLAEEQGRVKERKLAKKNRKYGRTSSAGEPGTNSSANNGLEGQISGIEAQLFGYAERAGLTGNLAPKIGRQGKRS